MFERRACVARLDRLFGRYRKKAGGAFAPPASSFVVGFRLHHRLNRNLVND
jgi:hypothetical protein